MVCPPMIAQPTSALSRDRRAKWRDRFSRERDRRNSHDVERGDRTSAHREDVGERVGRGDLAVGEWIVDDRGKEIDRLHEGAIAIETENARVVGRWGTDEHVAVCDTAGADAKLAQGLLAQLGSSAGAGRERGQFADLLARHAVHLLSE